MKKNWTRPVVECEQFVANEYVAACNPRTYTIYNTIPASENGHYIFVDDVNNNGIHFMHTEECGYDSVGVCKYGELDQIGVFPSLNTQTSLTISEEVYNDAEKSETFYYTDFIDTNDASYLNATFHKALWVRPKYGSSTYPYVDTTRTSLSQVQTNAS